MDVREASIPDELPAVRALFEAYAASLDVDLAFQDFAGEVAALPGDFVGPRGGLWLAIHGGRPVGCVALRPLDRTSAELKRLYLEPAARGTGLGRRLVEAALARARTAGCERVCLDTLPTMHGAIALYRSLGFADIARYNDNPVPGVVFLAVGLA